MGDLPDRLRVGSGDDAVYERRPQLRSVRLPTGAPRRGAVAVIPADAATHYVVFEGPGDRGPSQEQGPVYSAGPAGPLAVPTGRVLVRLTADLRPAQRQHEFQALGFEIERVLPYAPHTAWLRRVDGDVEAALIGLKALARVPGAEHVEPQLLLERAFRGG